MFDGVREELGEHPRPKPAWNGRRLPLILGPLIGILLLLLALSARAQNPPSGTPVFNQITQIRQVTVGTTKFVSSKAILLTDGTACQITVLAAGDSASQTLSNMQTGIWQPMSLVQISATTCTSAIFAGY